MKYYRCYLLDARLRIAKAFVIKAADDDEATRESRAAFAANEGGYCGFEIWDCARWVNSYPAEANPRAEARRRRGDAAAQDSAIGDALSEEIARDRLMRLGCDDAKTVRLKELRLEFEAAAEELPNRRQRRVSRKAPIEV